MLNSKIGIEHLTVYHHTRRLNQIPTPTSVTVLAWLEMLDGDLVTELVLSCSQRWLVVGLLDDAVSICVSDWTFETCESAIISRHAAADTVMRLLQRPEAVA